MLFLQQFHLEENGWAMKLDGLKMAFIEPIEEFKYVYADKFI
jgi:hypothetical protein